LARENPPLPHQFSLQSQETRTPLCRETLRARPIWGDGYDKRFCYDERSVRVRIEYVQRHNLAAGRPAKPWGFIEEWGLQ